MKKIITDTPVIKDIDIMRDVIEILNIWTKSNKYNNVFTVPNYSEYVVFKVSSKGGIKEAVKESTGCDQTLLSEDEAQIRSLVNDVARQTEAKIQSFNISKMGYNKSSIQQLTSYIMAKVKENQKGPVKYEFEDEFFMDLVYSICERSNKMITDQHRKFREANDPVIYVEKKRGEYYSMFHKYCHGATSVAIFGEIICQKLKEPIEQSVYKKTARDMAGEMRSNCPSLNGNRSNLEKHILKTLAEEENFEKYMNYIKTPKEHFSGFIRDEVSRYINDKFSVSVLPKMKENIKFLQQKIMKAAHESTEHVQVNREDVGLWLKSFTEKLSDVLISSVKDLSGMKHDDDLNFLEDVIRQELHAIMFEICSRFNTETFPVKLDYTFRPDELLIDHFSQCCWVECPFCKATCTSEIHDGDHSVPFHRVNGVSGISYHSTQILCANICTDLVASDKNLNTQHGQIPFREYRRMGGVYAVWRITPSLSELPYWKWFVCRFQKDLEKYYIKKFEIHDKFKQWRKYSKEHAIKSLDE